MTRWARATAPSEKKYEESTPWEQMQKGVKEKKKKAEKKNADETKKAKKKKKVKTSKDPSTASTESNDFERKHSELKKNLGLEPGGLAAELEKLKNENPGIDQNEEDEIRTMIKKEERRENRRLKRIKERDSHKMCFHCREHGHDMASCPKLSQEQGTGICFKCGSTEHAVQKCRVKLPPGEYPYAKCFICGETGHLSKQCADNPRGLYPNGGCCKLCGSVEHYKRDCPEAQKKQGIVEMRLKTDVGVEEHSDWVDDNAPVQEEPVKKKPKVVKF